MTHIISYLKVFFTIMVVAVLTNYTMYIALKSYISDSEFRLVLAGNAGEKYNEKNNIIVFAGNSRLMAGVNANSYSHNNKSPAYNIAYNGMEAQDVQDYVGSFIDTCNCDVATVVLNVDVFRKRAGKEMTEFRTFLAAFNDTVFDKITGNDIFEKIKFKLFPLLLFNNELFSRALYYKAMNVNDQMYSNNYTLKVRDAIIGRLKSTKLDQRIDVENIKSVIKYFSKYDIETVFVIAPYHRSYIDNVQGFKKYVNGMKKALSRLDVKYFDHSELYYNDDDMFSDPIHLVREGQGKYTKFLSDTFSGTDDDL